MQFSDVIELGNSSRTEDVRSAALFQSLMISPAIVTKMASHGFKYPSPVQEKAIPTALSGFDLLVQAKSGTGKTLVFSVMAVENLNTRLNTPQRLLIAPTREIAIQIRDTVKKLQPQGCRTHVLVGGNPLFADRQALKKGQHIVIGTTGRICQLLQEGDLKLDTVELFVLDEADKLMDEDFQKDINFIFSHLPPSRQVAVFSATYPRNLDDTLGKYMKNATLIRLNSDDVQLIGIKQYMSIVFDTTALEAAVKIFESVTFTQALVFCNTYLDEPICSRLVEAGFDAGFISSKMSQPEREKVIERLKTNNIQILVSTDLTARGVDATNVNMVINIGAAIDVETYFHRIGRAARFGGQGAAISLLEDGRSVAAFNAIVSNGGIKVKVLDRKRIPMDLASNTDHFNSCVDFLSSKRLVKPVAKVRPVSVMPTSTDVQVFRDFDIVKGGSCCYNRNEMCSLNENLPQLSEQFLQRLRDLQITKVTYCDEIDTLATQMKAAKNDPSLQKEEKKPEKKVFKFVPSREKAKKKFYLRGELLAVRDGLADEHWLDLAKSKFNMNEDPFVQPEQRIQDNFDALLNELLPSSPNNDLQNKENEIPSESDELLIGNNLDKKESQYLDSLIQIPEHAYSREDLIQIQQDWPREWLEYTTNKWNTKEDPWVMDPAMRCSMTEQIRKQRDAEKQARIKVMRQREEAAKKDEVVSSSRTITIPTIEATSWEDFCQQIQKDFEAFKLSPSNNLGSVVPVRDSPAIWKERVSFYADWCSNLEASFAKDIKISMDLIRDEEVGTDDTFLDDMLNALKISVDPDEEASNYETAPEESDSKDTVAENANHSEEEVQKTSETCPDINEIKKESAFDEKVVSTDESDQPSFQQPSVEASRSLPPLRLYITDISASSVPIVNPIDLQTFIL